jgi:hypothetical protein
MKTWIISLVLWTSIYGSGFSQSNPFSGVPLPPFGSGHRQLKGYLPKDNSPVNATEVYVFYSENSTSLSSVSVGNGLPHGRATLRDAGNGKLEYTFIFPHTDAPSPNAQDRNATSIGSGKKVFYRVLKRVRNAANEDFRDETRDFIMPDKLTIGLIGDSYGSGEGAPDDPADDNNTNMWTNDPCHRSMRSGQVRAVKQVKEAHPELAIAYKHRSCSGAEIDELFEKRQNVSNGTAPIQLVEIKNWLQTNNFERLDILVMSVGGNDVGMVGMVTDYLFTPGPELHKDTEMQDDIDDIIQVQLPEAYRQLNNYIRGNFLVDEILITEYPNPLRGPGGICGGNVGYGNCWGPLEAQNTKEEFQYAQDKVLAPTNNRIKASAQELGWRYVAGPFNASGNRGICDCSTGYFNGLVRSFAQQLDHRGTFHPNAEGHKQLYQPFIYNSLESSVTKIRLKWDLKRLLDAIQAAKDKAKEQAARQAYLARYTSNVSRTQTVFSKLHSVKLKYEKKIGVNRNAAIEEIRKTVRVQPPSFPTPIQDKFSIKTEDDFN